MENLALKKNKSFVDVSIGTEMTDRTVSKLDHRSIESMSDEQQSND